VRNDICLFSSYFSGGKLPYYIRIYLRELRNHIKQVVLIVVQELDEESKLFLKDNGITFYVESNEGYDFGAWYKTFQKINIREFEHVFLVNDSCILFRPLDPFMQWLDENTANVKGFTYSEAVNPHIQSYFTVLDKKAVELAINYFRQNGIKAKIGEVISTYELGMSNYFSSNGLKLAAFVDNGGYQGEFSPYYKCVDHHLKQGIPLIKKKILFASYRKDELGNLARMGLNIDPLHYYSLIKQQKDLVIDLDRLQKENPPQMSSFQILSFNIKKALIKLVRPFYKAVKK
jgi:lipopolysaccharide biosynthesis protein